jgi:hypothetical protein
MRKCPFCLQEVPEEAKVCKHCGKTLVKRCTSCNQEILAAAVRCRHCGADLSAPGALPVKATVMRSDAPCGERREVVMTLLLILMTCGIWGLVVQYKMAAELNLHRGRNELNPGLDLLLVFLTCGLWVFYLMYKYPQTLQEIIHEEGGPPTDLVLPCLLFTFFGMHIVALLILQGELNKHWELHQHVGT